MEDGGALAEAEGVGTPPPLALDPPSGTGPSPGSVLAEMMAPPPGAEAARDEGGSTPPGPLAALRPTLLDSGASNAAQQGQHDWNDTPGTPFCPSRGGDTAEGAARSTPAPSPPAPVGYWAPTKAFWEAFGQRVLCRWMWELVDDPPHLPSQRYCALRAAFLKLPVYRLWITKALAEVSADHLETFLRDLKNRRRFRHAVVLEAEAAAAGRMGGRRIVGGIGDGGYLVDLLSFCTRTVSRECQNLTPSAPPGTSTWLTAQLELLARAFVNAARTRPLLDEHFEVLCEVVSSMVPPRPHIALVLLHRFLAAWPRKDAGREVSWLRLTQTVMLACPAPLVTGQRALMRSLVYRIIECLTSDHAAVARGALDLISNMYVRLYYILPSRGTQQAVTRALVANRAHWSPEVRAASEEQFDQMLEFA